MVSGKARSFRFFVCFLLLGCMLGACTDGGGGGAQSQGGSSVGSEGGTVALSGAKVYIPPNALSAEEFIDLKVVPLPKALPAGYMAAGPCVSFTPEGVTFSQQATIYLPYEDANNDGIVDGKGVPETKVKVLYYNQAAGAWEWMPMQGCEEDGNLALAQTGHFSTYLAVIDTGDATPLDPGTDTGTTSLTSGDCLVGNGNKNNPYGYEDSCFSFNLTVTRRESGMLALVDRYATFVQTGIPATISPEGDSATFDAASAFAKVQQSGDAGLWGWEAEFVPEHTYLKEYDVVDDALAGTDPSATGIYCQIEAVDANMVKITWQINLYEQIVYIMSPGGGGHALVVRFRAFFL
jgi:hypothetical protein